jgi:hypothetical protein
MVLYRENGWKHLAYPQHQKNFLASESAITWPTSGTVDSDFLYERSKPIEGGRLERQIIRLSYKNQPAAGEDNGHHVYGVFLAPYSPKPFRLDESIGGGMADRGGGYDFSLDELLMWPNWRHHFELSGCKWAAVLVDSLSDRPEALIDSLIKEACKRNGSPEPEPI